MEHIFFHIDVNSAFLSWTAVQRLSEGETLDIRTIPSIIGGDAEKRHGIVLAKSIPAKVYGIVTGEPIVNALKKCPNLMVVSPAHSRYGAQSRELMDFLSTISPDLEQASIDECYMDYTPIAHKYTSPEDCANMIKNEVKKRFGFTVNIGISDKKVLAKMASDFKKPDLVHTLYSYEIEKKLWPLPVEDLFMCGRSSVETLHKLEVLTIGDLAHIDPTILNYHLKGHGMLLYQFANGEDDSVVMPLPSKRKGVGTSTTLEHDLTTRQEASDTFLRLCDSVSRSLREEGDVCSLVSVEIKYATFTSVSHQMTLPTPSNAANLLHQTALRLFDSLWNSQPIRLLGVRVSKLSACSEPVQMNLFDMVVDKKQEKLNHALDSIRNKYGNSAIVRGSLYKSKEKDGQ